jgi:Putative MetA-pathway of phenol degradation
VETMNPRLRLLTSFASLFLALGQVRMLAQKPDTAGSGGSQMEAAKPPTQVQIDNAESTSKPDDVQIPQANPARPTITNPATLPPVGYVQFEQGLLQAGSSPDGLARQFSLVQTVKLSIHPRLMVDFASQPIAVSRAADSPGDPALSRTDAGDLLVGFQALMVKGKDRQPSIAVGFQQRVRSGTAPDLDIGSFSRTGLVLISGDLGGFHYDSNFSVSEQGGDPVRRAQYGRTLSVSHGLFSEKLSISGEIWNFTQPLVDTTRSGAASQRSEAVGTLWALGYTVRPNLVLDGGFDRGITSTSTAWQGFVGFTYVLPHRLWRGGGR